MKKTRGEPGGGTEVVIHTIWKCLKKREGDGTNRNIAKILQKAPVLLLLGFIYVQ